MPDHDSLLELHFERNRVTRRDWDGFAPHRARVTQLLLDAACSEHPSLCVLGAGNGNDIDLRLLAQRFDKITLVDFDREALDHCLAKYPANVTAQVETVSDADLSQILECLQSSPRQPLAQETIVRAGNPSVPSSLSTYDVVASTCLLTQMIGSIAESLGSDHPQFAELTLAVRDGHLRLIHDLTAANGTGILITDFVSSDTLSALQTVADPQLESLLAGAISEGNFFTGVNPGVLARRFQELATSGSQCSVQVDPPWRWQMGNRMYAVCAVAASNPLCER